MFSKPQKNQRVKLDDFDYQREIFARLFLAELNPLEREAFEEILFLPISFTIDSFAKNLDLPLEQACQTLEKISESQLVDIQNNHVSVDKELRKFFEFHLSRFDETFKPSISYIIQLLNQVPIGVLLDWYTIPRTSNHIISSIIEKYLMTPKIFQQHMAQFLSEEPPLLREIVNSVYESPHLKVSIHELQNRFELSYEELHRYILDLEFNFLCFLNYERVGEEWIEFLTPFHEIKTYYLQLRTISSSSTIEEQAFNEEKFPLLEQLIEGLVQAERGILIHSKETKDWLLSLGFLEEIDGKEAISQEGKEWKSIPLKDQACIFHRKLLLCEELSLLSDLFTVKDFRSLEKCFRDNLTLEWMPYQDFIARLHVPFGNEEEIILKKTTGGWQYMLPKYSPKTLNWIQKAICYYVEIGLLKSATFEDRTYIALTSFGQTLF